MKIAIPVDKNCMDSTVCSSYSHAPYFFLYDLKTNMHQFLLRHTAYLVNDADIRVYRAQYDTLSENIEAFEKDQLEIMTELRPDLYQSAEQ